MGEFLGYHKNCGGKVRRQLSHGYSIMCCSRCGGLSVHIDDITWEQFNKVRQKTVGVKRRKRLKYDINSWKDVK